jgi:hypothetical protein
MNGVEVSSSAVVGNVPIACSVVGAGDFNGDGMIDIVWRDNSGNLGIWLMNGAAISSSAGLGNVPTNWTIVQTGDYNGDGMSDLLWRDTSGNTATWFMNGTTVASTAGLGNIPGIAPRSVELCEASAAVNDVKRPSRFEQLRDCLFPFRSEQQARLVRPEVA